VGQGEEMTVLPTYNTQAARSEVPEGALLLKEFEDALVGYGFQFSYPIAVYSRKRCIEILIEDGIIDYEGATEYFDFNVAGAYMGESTPVFLDDEFDYNEE
jgi:hypothetical protein